MLLNRIIINSKFVLTPKMTGLNFENKLGQIKFGNYDKSET